MAERDAISRAVYEPVIGFPFSGSRLLLVTVLTDVTTEKRSRGHGHLQR